MNTTIKEQLDKYFEAQEKADKEILNQITLYIYWLESNTSNSDLFILARLLSSTQLYKIISYYDGDILKMPTKEDFKKSFILSICFYLKEIKGWDWPKIKEFFPTNEEYTELVSSISIGKRINKIKNLLGKDLLKLLKNLNVDKIKDYQQELFKGGQ